MCELIVISQYSSSMSTPRTAATIVGKAAVEKGKFQQDQANRLEDIKRKLAEEKSENDLHRAQKLKL